MKHSIRTRLILTLTILLLSMIMIFWCMNLFFFEYYYEWNKVNRMVKVFREVDEISQQEETDGDEEANGIMEEEISDALSDSLERMEAKNGVNLYLFEFVQSIYGTTNIHFIFDTMNDKQKGITYQRIEEYVKMTPVSSDRLGELLVKDKNFVIRKMYDDRIDIEYMECFGKLQNDNWLYLKSNYENMKESVGIANQFLGYIGSLMAISGIIIMFFIGRSFTKPILSLSDIAEKISKLDFNAKYREQRCDEIGILGNSMNSLSEKLEHTISELKSANNELQSDIERKAKMDEMRQEFLSNVSHELKTPIALIQGYAEGLQDNVNDDPESRRFYCEVIIDEANKMNRMVKKLLDLNQLEFGYDKVQFEHFDIVEVVRSVLFSSEILFKQKEVTLIFDEYEPIYVWAEEYFVEEVVTNYISNALNHVKEPGIIEIKLLKKDDVVRVSVFNTGMQIAEEDLDKIWEKFYKIDKARTREYGGNGIGLSIVKAIMTSLNQECGVLNRDNGVEFWFELDVRNN